MKIRSKTNNNLTVHLEGRRIIIRNMRPQDLKDIQAWRPFTDPLHALWNIPRDMSPSRDLWPMLRGSKHKRALYVIERRADGIVIGRLSLREITGHTSARLGIALGADFVNQGYGSEALRLFLPYYFHTLGFRRLYLDVAATNKRAIHVYEKLGFQRMGSHYRDIPLHHDLSLLKQEQYRNLRIYFRRHLGRMQLLFYDMKLDRSDWDKRSSTDRQSPLYQ